MSMPPDSPEVPGVVADGHPFLNAADGGHKPACETQSEEKSDGGLEREEDPEADFSP